MKNYLGMIAFILCMSLVLIFAMLVSTKLQGETPIPDPNNPTPPENDPCWYVEFPGDL